MSQNGHAGRKSSRYFRNNFNIVLIDKLEEILKYQTWILPTLIINYKIVARGYPVSFSDRISMEEKTEIIELLGILGKTFETPEDKLEAYAIISAMSPTYFWFQWKKLADIGTEIGLTKDESDQTVYETMISALNTMFNSTLAQPDVFDLIPAKPMEDKEEEIMNVFDQKLKGLYSKLTS